jgi:hypothetical protein
MSRCFPPPPPWREARLSGSEHLGEQAGGTHAEHDRAGRVKVRVDLSVPSHPDIFVVGDIAAVTGQFPAPRRPRSRWAAMSAGSSPRASQAGLRHRHSFASPISPLTMRGSPIEVRTVLRTPSDSSPQVCTLSPLPPSPPPRT